MDLIAHRFAKAVELNPNAIAIDGADGTYTYADLATLAGRVAAYLSDLSQNLDQDQPRIAGVYAKHGPDAIVSILGIVLAGWTFTPVDTNSEYKAAARMLASAGALVVFTDATNMDRVSELARDIHMVLSLPEIYQGMSNENVRLAPVQTNAPAYILHTSGSSGEPKAIAHSRASLIRSVECYCSDSNLEAGDRVSLAMPLGFTPSVFSVFGTLLSGATLCPLDITHGGMSEITGWAYARKLTLLYTTPTVFRRWASGLPDVGKADASSGLPLRMIQLAGEPLLASDVALFKRKFPPTVHLYNGMGTTETSCAARFVIDHSMSFSDGPVPVGYPYDDIELVLRNQAGRMLGAGEIGELSIGGDCLKLLNTGAEFETGDLAMCDEGGRFTHLGRGSDRVIINGVSVDLPEIESLLMKMDQVNEAAVIAVGTQSELKLAAFVSFADNADADTQTVQHFLSEQLPQQMVPAYCVGINNLPILPVGKVDRLALHDLVPDTPSHTHISARDPDTIDDVVMKAFCGVLGLASLPQNADFFELGGTAHAALELVMRIESDLGIGLSVSRFSHAPTPVNLAHELRCQLRHGEQANGLSDMDQVWQLDHSPAPERTKIDVAQIPEPQRTLLDHQNSMTATLARWAKCDVSLRVLAQRQAGRYFMRKIELVSATGYGLAVAAIRIDLKAFASDVRLEIISGDTPFGTTMSKHGIELKHEPEGFFRSDAKFGRTNRIKDQNGHFLADVTEVLRETE